MICPVCKSPYLQFYKNNNFSSCVCGYEIKSWEEYVYDLNCAVFEEIKGILQGKYVGLCVTDEIKMEIYEIIKNIMESYDLGGRKEYKVFTDYFKTTKELNITFTDKDENIIL